MSGDFAYRACAERRTICRPALRWHQTTCRGFRSNDHRSKGKGMGSSMKAYKVAIAGATGAVGREMMKVLEEREFPISELIPLASERSEGEKLEWQGRE